MASPVQFAVDDSSPVLVYSPFADTLGHPDLAAGWNAYFVGSGFVSSLGQTGVGESQHITARNGSSITLRWHGTALQLFGNTTADASLSLILDGVSVSRNISTPTPNLLAFYEGLPHAEHTLVLTALIPSPPGPSLVVFDKAVITDPPTSDLIFSDHTLSDSDIAFTGQWSQLPFPRVRESSSQGDTARVTFSGISIRIFGTTSPSSGNYSIILDDIQSSIFSARSSFTQYDSLLFFASGLDPNVSHHVIIRNEGGTLQLRSGGSGIAIFSSGEPTALPPSPSSPSSSPPANTPSPPPSGIGKFAKGTIAALVLAGFLAALLLTAVLFYFCIWRPRRRRKRARQQQHQDTTSQLDRHPKEEQTIPVILDIGQQHRPDDILLNSPVDVLTPLSPITPNNGGVGGPYNERHAESKPSPGFARWKRDINALSGLTNLGLKFRHEDSDEKSPLSDDNNNGRRYASEGDELSPISPLSVGRMRSLTTQSSYRSLRLLGKKRSAGNNINGGRGGGGSFPFRFNSGRSSSNIGGGAGGGEGQVSSPRTRDEDSFSGFTSLSYASDPNQGQNGDNGAVPATPTIYLDVQPPSYAVSVSQTSGSSSGVASPGVGGDRRTAQASSGSEQQQQQQQQQQQRRQREPSSSSSSSGNQQRGDSTRMRGIRMLGLGGGGGGIGIGGPVSMRAAIRSLSPRISRTRHGGGNGNGKEREGGSVGGEEEREHEHEQAGSEVSQSSIALASLGHGRENVEILPVPPRVPVMMMMPERRNLKTDSPAVRALPPIPVTTAPLLSSTILSPPSPLPPLSSSSPSSSSSPTTPSSPTTTTTEKKPLNTTTTTKITRSSPGDAVGLPPLGAIQSFSEAAAIAINAGSMQLVGDGSGGGAGGQGGETKRSSTASRVRFEEPDDTLSGVSMEGEGRGREEKMGFRLTPLMPLIGDSAIQGLSSSGTGYAPLPPGALSPFSTMSPTSPATAAAADMTVAEYGRSSFLDLSSQPPSIHSTFHDNVEDGDKNNSKNERVWSMQLPGRRDLQREEQQEQDMALKSKWSNTTIQTGTRTLEGGGGGGSTESSSASSAGGGDGLLLLSPTTMATTTTTERQNLFPWPLAIPPSPNMPEGFVGVEPSPSLMSPNVSLPVPFSGGRKKKREGGNGGEGGENTLGVGAGGDASAERRRRTGGDDNITTIITTTATTTATTTTDEATTDSPTDSFPYSISDVHFRNSAVFVSEPEVGDSHLDDEGELGGTGFGGHTTRRRHRHRHHHQAMPSHPPLPSLTPQRFDPSQSQLAQTTLAPQRFGASLSQVQVQSQSQSQALQAPLTPQRFEPSSSQQTRPERQQQHERTQSFTTSIVQRVFGTR